MSQELIAGCITLLVAVFGYLKYKAILDAKLIDKKHDLAQKNEKLLMDNFKLKHDLTDAQMKEFKSQVDTVMSEIQAARSEIQQTNRRWEEVRKSLEGFTAKLKAEAEFTDSKVRKVEDMAMSLDKKVDQYRSEIIELGKDVFMVKGKKPNGPTD